MTSLAAEARSPVPPPLEDPWAGHSRFSGFLEVVVGLMLGLCALVSVLTTIGIVVVLSVQTVEFFMQAKIGVGDFLLGTSLKPEASPPRFGVLPLVWGTFLIALGSSCL